MRLLVLVFSFFVLAALAGCATLSKSQCQTGDWRSVGEADGRAGYLSARYTEHNEACAKHDISVDRNLYDKGYALGLKQYCTPNNAAKVGLAGRTYRNVCTGEIGLSFVRIYREANDVSSIDSDIASLQQQIDMLTKKLAKPDTTQAQRDDIAYDIRSLNGDISRKMRDRAREDAELRQVMLEEQNRLARL